MVTLLFDVLGLEATRTAAKAAHDFGKAADRVAADIRGYYEVTYTPAVANFDGGYRRISVKVARGDVVLQSRRGYFALPPSDQVVLPYETPLLAALSAPAPAHDFAHHAAALHFGAEAEGTQTSVVVEVPLAPLDQLEALKQSNAVLRRVIPLAPGTYTLETVSQVRGSGKTSVQQTAFEIPAAASGPRLSSLSLLRRADPLAADAPASDDPFRVEATRLVPHVWGPVIPSSGFAPGQYEVRLTVTQGELKATESTRFELVP